MASDKPILIVGAGPTGLVLALSLAKQGCRHLRIVSRASGPGETSRALVVQARVLELYAQLGIADEVLNEGYQLGGFNVRSGGQARGSLDWTDFGGDLSRYPFALVYPQDLHERLLVKHLESMGVHIEWETELVDFEPVEEGVAARLQGQKGEEKLQASYICGCDGARGVVVRQAGIEYSTRGSAPQRFFVTDVEYEGGDLATDSLTVSFSDRDIFVLFVPLKTPGGARLGGVLPPEATESEVDFELVRESVEACAGIRVKRVNWFSAYRVSHRVAERFQHGCVFLLGDAAHTHSPLGGQGANTGIGDAFNLAWKLAAVTSGRTSPTILDSYEPERIRFARTLVATTDRAFSLISNRGFLGRFIRNVVVARLIPFVMARIPSAPRLAFQRISQIGIEYRFSPLSATLATGVLRAGDRLPFLAFSDGADNHRPLESIDWQLHVYGEASQGIRDLAARHSLDMHLFAWSDVAQARGFLRGAAYLVRPDGHVGLVAEQGGKQIDALESYLTKWGVRTRREMQD